MAILSKGTTFSDGDQLTSDSLNNLVDNSTFASGAVDDSTTQLSSGKIIVKDLGIATGKIATSAVTTAKIADSNVTKAKIENLADYKVLGNVSGGAAAPAEVAILDEDNMSSNSATSLATQQSIKAYVDTQITAEDLDFAGDSGNGSVDLDGETFTIAGATGLDTAASGQTLTVSLDLNELATETSIAQDDFVAMVDNTDSGNGKITFSNLEDQIFGNVSGAVSIAAGGAATVSAVTVADESSDTTCFPLFATAATGSLGPKSGSNLTFNSSTGLLTATTLSGILADGVTGTTQSSGDNSTKVATTAYVDAQVGTSDTLAEVLANGNTTGSNNIVVSNGQSITTNTISETTSASGVTIDGVLIKDNAITASGEIDGGSLDISGDADIDGTLEADAITVNGTALATVIAGTTVTNATNSAHVLVTDNESTNEENLITFVEGATSSTGNVGLEMDGNFAYNPSTGTVSATIFKGNIDAVDGDFDGTLEADAITIGGTAIGSLFSPLAGGSDIVTTGALNSGSITSGFGNIDIGSSNLTSTGSVSLGATSFNDNDITNVGSIALDTITNDGTDVTIDSSGDIVLDAGGADIRLKDDGTQFGRFANSSSNLIVASSISDKDILFNGSDGGVQITALTLDMSDAGAATFNDKITAVGTSVFTNLDISGDIDVDGTTNLDAVDIDGAVDMASTLTVADDANFDSGTLFVDASANKVGIGTTAPAKLLHVKSSNSDTAESLAHFGNGDIDGGLEIKTNGNGGASLDWGFNAVNSRNLVFDTNQTERMRITSTGEFHINGGGSGSIVVNDEDSSLCPTMTFLRNGAGTSTNDFIKFENNGGEVASINSSGGAIFSTVSKGSGSFKIAHPLESKKDTHNLVHSFLESPQADLIYRGRVDLVDGLASVNIDLASDMTDGTFVLLCRDVQSFTTNESGWTAVRSSVDGNILTIEAQDNTCTDSISWMVVGERQDQHMYDTEWTDENGKVVVEPLIPEPTPDPEPETEEE